MSLPSINPSDAAWASLLDEDALSARRKAAEDKFRNLSGAQIKGMRRRAKNDLFFLTYGVLEYDLLSERFHGHYAQWLAKVRGERYRMTLFARDHYKTTINTVSDSIQMALPGGEDLPYPYNLGPNIKLLLSHEVRESASRFLFEITQAFREKTLMLVLFPELIPSPRVQRMNKWELELPRQQHHREPTFDTMGVGGAAQGRHYNWLKLDDLIGEDARESETVMKRALDWFDNINSLLTRLKYDGWDLVGTRWAPKDIYSHAQKMYGVNKPKSILNCYFQKDRDSMEDGQLVVYGRGAVENGVPVFPEEFTIEDLNRIRKNPKVWAAQYANNPREGNLTRLHPEWLKFYQVGRGDRLITFTSEGTRIVRVSELDRLVMIDPSMGQDSKSDESGFVVTGTDQFMNIYVLAAYRKRLLPPEMIEEMFNLYYRWTPRLISIEEVNFSAVFRYWFEQKCSDLGIYPSVYPYKRPGGRNSKRKDEYIEALSNYGAGGQIYVLEGMHQLRDEWEWFPIGENKHILDALSQGPEIWAPAVVREQREVTEAVKAVMDHRDALTGY